VVTVIVPSCAVGDIWVLASTQSAPGHGVLPVNAFLLRDDPAILIDTGLSSEADRFMDTVWSLVGRTELAAVFLTHEDADHAGNLLGVLDAAPEARLVTNYVTLGKLLERMTVPLDRVDVVNPGDRVPGTSRPLTVLRPPVYDAPGTMGLHDAATGAVVTVDAFGAYLPQPACDASEVAVEDLLSGLVTFNRVNHPWTAMADAGRFGAALDAVADLAPTVLLSSHAPPAGQAVRPLIDALRRLPELEEYIAPDQQAFELLKPLLAS
jgi:glyoxylase-like metal-dependent hydrolase (beta-lactamase superfamily II)